MAVEWRDLFIHLMNIFNMLIVAYFFLANGGYTILMALSLSSLLIYNRRLRYQGLEELRDSVVTPPVTVIMPAYNEQEVIVESVRSVLRTDYPYLEVVVVDDGSSDESLNRLIAAYQLIKMDLIYRPRLATEAVRGFYLNPAIPNLLVIRKDNGGKFDALNVGINACRTPYFCTLDADCILERDALLRLMRPIKRDPLNIVASGGIVRILNGCEVKDGQVVTVELPDTALERFQVVEYLRGFLFGRTGWDLLHGTLIVSGAFAVFHRETVIEAAGFNETTVSEDMELIVRLHRWARENERRIKMKFISDPVCWTEAPANRKNLAAQRRRWHMGLYQTLWLNSDMLFSRKFGRVGWLSYPFQLYVEALGAPVEFLGYIMVPLALLLGIVPPSLFLLFVLLALAYGSFLSVGSVLMEELTYRRYPRYRDLLILLGYALLENIGYRQLVVWYRVQGFWRFLTGFQQWEKVTHGGAEA